MSWPVRSTPEAERQVREIDDWWRKNRLSAPDLFLEELETAIEIVANTPLIGRPYRRKTVAGLRRLLLKATRYHIYYVSRPDEVRILAVWHAQRGVGPPLRM